MKTISLTQPWATLVALGAKRIETRNWRTSYRGPLGIHAASGLGPVHGKRGLLDLIEREPFWSVLREAFAVRLGGEIHYPADAETIIDELPFGAIVATCTLKDCRIIGLELNGVPTISADDMLTYTPILGNERAFGNYAAGRFAWLLSNIRALAEPIPAKGALGLWEYEGELPLLGERL